jgi:hypothetical protein
MLLASPSKDNEVSIKTAVGKQRKRPVFPPMFSSGHNDMTDYPFVRDPSLFVSQVVLNMSIA